MTKRFCDLCGKPAVDDRSNGFLIYIKTPAPSFGKDTVIVTAVNFRIEQHPTNYSGPPDLCESCRYGLATAAAEAVQPEENV